MAKLKDFLFINYKRINWSSQEMITVRDAHRRESATRRQQNLNMCRTWVQTVLNEFVQ